MEHWACSDCRRLFKPLAKEIRFRLSHPRVPIDKTLIFNAPRDSSLRKTAVFLQGWLAKAGHHQEGDGKVYLVRDGEVMNLDKTFLDFFGPSAGTQKDPVTMGFIFEKDKKV